MPRATPRPANERSALLHVIAGLAALSLCSGNVANRHDDVQDVRQPFRTVRRSAPALFSAGDQQEIGAPAAAPAGFSPNWPFQPTQLNIDISRGAASVPVLLVPVPVPGPPAACDATIQYKRFGGQLQGKWPGLSPGYPAQHPPASAPVPVPASVPVPAHVPVPAPVPVPADPIQYTPDFVPASVAVPAATPSPPARPTAAFPAPLPETRFPSLTFTPQEDYFAPPPQLQPIFTSQQLVKEFQAQTPLAPELTPMVLSSSDASERAPLPTSNVVLAAAVLAEQQRQSTSNNGERPWSDQRSVESQPGPRSPPPQYHQASLTLMRGQVTVPRADYTEPYKVWFDPASGNARVDFHGGSTSTFRSTLPDGRERRSLVWVQRWDGRGERRCATATSPRRAAPAPHPALPDLAGFIYAGTEETPDGPLELWQRTVTGAAGGQGAARGEVLTTRHEMRLTRVDRAARPWRYTVTVDSSVLGSNCDGYEHVYEYEAAPPPPAEFFDVDLDTVCYNLDQLNASLPEHLARLEPLREFTQPSRDQRYDQVFTRYQTQYARQYADRAEEAVRKNVLMQSTRFAASGNRQGATSQLDTTLLADRLRAEVRSYTGGTGAAAALAVPGARAAPRLSRARLREEEGRLPTSLDWRRRGAVSPVQNQGLSCSSCWAFAVAGAVEGALFRRTRRLVPLSPQCLVDCAQPFGGKGCTGTWPAHAYNYVQARGLPAQSEYPEYHEKVGQCQEQSVPSQTRISGHVNVTSNSLLELQIAIKQRGPNVVVVDAHCQSFILHKTGVLEDERCGKTLRKLNHAVLATGWGELKGQPHFILKNSWSVRWGDMGYVRVHARSNTCGVLTMPSYPLLEAGDVKQPLRAGARAQSQGPEPAHEGDGEDFE